MNQLAYVNVQKPTPSEISTNSAEYKSTHLYITEYSSGFLLLLVKQPGTQHVKSPFLLLVLGPVVSSPFSLNGG